MSSSTHLERRYRRLLAFYPAAFRREHEEEILSVLMDGAAEGQQRPGLAESVNLLTHAISMRWASPPRPGMQRLIVPWEYRHLRVFGVTRIAGGIVATCIGAFVLSYSAYGWAAFFLVIGALDLAVGAWELAIARSASPRT